jgi:hypothetical protein
MSWYWLLHKTGSDEPGRSSAFPTQADAESWIGEAWREVRAAGVEAVSLCEDDRVAYGPMSLDA